MGNHRINLAIKSAPRKTNPSCHERRSQEEVVGPDQGALGCEEKKEGVVQSLNSTFRIRSYARFPSRENAQPRLKIGAGDIITWSAE